MREDRGAIKSVADLDLEELAKKLNMNVINLSKFKSSLRRLGKNKVTAKELSEYMNISQRSARRILAQLEEKGAAKILENKSVLGKGRPSRVYQILI